jgi:ABC-type bacteriocin/lantibiotic exporter with double-glycine peptidase domain
MTEHDQTQEDTGKGASQKRPAGKARGCFFAAFETFPYAPRGVVFGQNKQDSCVAACCRMLLSDQGIELPESDIRAALKVDGGAFISKLPEVLRQCGLTTTYQYRHDLTIDDLRLTAQQGPAVAFVARPREKAGHALIIEQITEQRVCVRDPLPEVEGQAYQVVLSDFLLVWIRPQTGSGQAAIVVG